MRALPLVHAVAPAVDDALAVTHRYIVIGHAERLDQRGAGDRRGAGAVDDDLDVLEVALGQVAGVDQPSGGDDRGAVLIVVHDRYFHALAKGLLDHEALGRSDVFQVDAAEARLHQRDRVDERLGVFGREFDVDRIDVGEALEQHRLAFHYRLRSERAQVPHAEDRGTVRNDRDEVALGGVFPGGQRVLGDRLDRRGDSRRIGEAEVALGFDGMISILPGRPVSW